MSKKQNNEHWKVFVYLFDEIRKQNGQTYADVANDMGLEAKSWRDVGRYMRGEIEPKAGRLIDIGKAVGVNLFCEAKNSTTDLNPAIEAAMERLGRRPDKLPKN